MEKVYNGITDDDTRDNILNLSIVYLLWCWGLLVVSPHACFRAFLVHLVHASLVVLVSVIRTKF